ncbi:MAG: hypothetical protein WDO70_05415 [Alphaproteobacteria bacterium]
MTKYSTMGRTAFESPSALSPLSIEGRSLDPQSMALHIAHLHDHYASRPVAELQRDITKAAGIDMAGQGQDSALARAGQEIAQTLDTQAAATPLNKNPYHDVQHHREVMINEFVCRQITDKLTGQKSSKEDYAAGTTLAAGHDNGHPGGSNDFPFQFEEMAFKTMKPVLDKHGVSPKNQDKVHIGVLSTDPINKKLLDADPRYDAQARHDAQILGAADVLGSLAVTIDKAHKATHNFADELEARGKAPIDSEKYQSFATHAKLGPPALDAFWQPQREKVTQGVLRQLKAEEAAKPVAAQAATQDAPPPASARNNSPPASNRTPPSSRKNLPNATM